MPPSDSDPQPTEQLASEFGRHFSSGEVIYTEGDSAREAFLLQLGRIRLLKRVSGRERNLRIIKAGDLFGESGLMPQAERTETAVAMSDGLLLVLGQPTLEGVLARHPAMGLRVIRQLVTRLRDAEDRIEVGMLHDSRSKVVLALLRLAQHNRALSQVTSTRSLELVLSPMDLSTRVGLDVDTVKRTVQELREAGHLQIIGDRVAIPDLETLRELYALFGVRDQIVGLNRPGGSNSP